MKMDRRYKKHDCPSLSKTQLYSEYQYSVYSMDVIYTLSLF